MLALLVAGVALPAETARGQARPRASTAGDETAEIVALDADTGGLRIRSSAPIRGVTAITDDEGRPQILLAGHHASRVRVHRFDRGWIETIEERSDRGDGVGFVRLLLTTRSPVRYRLHTDKDTVWLQLADARGQWIPIGSGQPIRSLEENDAGAGSTEARSLVDAPSRVEPVSKVATGEPPEAVAAAPAKPASSEDPEDLRLPLLQATRGVNVRARPSPSQPLLGTLEAGRVVRALERRWGWVRISFEGREGWIYGRYLKAAAEETGPSDQEPGP